MPWHVELSRSDDAVACPGCFTSQPLVGPFGSEPVLAYALNTLFDRALGQNCVSHVLTELFLRQTQNVIWAVPGADIGGPNDEPHEVDVLAISRDALIIGELEATSAAFRRGYVRGLGELARKINADSPLLGSLDKWSADHANKVADWIGAGVRVVVAGDAELLAAEPVRDGPTLRASLPEAGAPDVPKP